MQRSSQSSAPENIDPEDTWLTTDLEEDTRKTPSHNPGVSPENNNKMLMSSQSVLHAKKSPDIKEVPVSEVIECTSYERV